MTNDTALLFVQRLQEGGLSDEDITFIVENRLLAKAAAKTLENWCVKAKLLDVSLLVTEESDFAGYMRKARLMLGESASGFEIRITAAIMECAQDNPGHDPSITTIARILNTSRQNISQGIRTHNINFKELKRRFL